MCFFSQVHFKSVLKGADVVFDSGEKLKVELDSLLGVVRQQSQELEATIAQVEGYQEVSIMNYVMRNLSFLILNLYYRKN